MQPAYVLHRRTYSDSSLLLELFTLGQGRIAAIARGAMSSKRGRAGLLQPFVPLLVEIRGRGEVVTLGKCEPSGRPHALGGNRLYCGLYLNELLNRLLPRHQPQPTLLAEYVRVLKALADVAEEDSLLRAFELQLLDALGMGLQLTHLADSNDPIDPQQRYHYLPLHGAVAARVDDSESIGGDTLLGLAKAAPLAPQQQREARRMMRRIIQFHLGDYQLKSRELFLRKSHDRQH